MATGLLGPSLPAPLLNSSHVGDGLSSEFVSNGLLGEPGTVPAHEEPEERVPALQEIEAVNEYRKQHSEQSDSFQPNGLLESQDAGERAHTCMASIGSLTSSLPSGTDTCTSSGMLYESQGRAFVSCAC